MPEILASDKDLQVGEYSNNFTWTKSLVDDLVVACNDIFDVPETTSMKYVDRKRNYLPLIYTIFLQMIYLVLLNFIDHDGCRQILLYFLQISSALEYNQGFL